MSLIGKVFQEFSRASGKSRGNLAMCRLLAIEPLEQRAMLSIGPGSLINPVTVIGVGQGAHADNATLPQTLSIAAQQAASLAIGQDQSAYHAAAGATGVTLTNSENGFTAQLAEADFGGGAGTIISDTDTQIVTTSAAGRSTMDLGQAAPTVTGVSPAAGPLAGGTTVTIAGTSFSNATEVDFGGMPATNMTVVSDTQITATSPAGSVGAVDVTVIGPGGTSVTSSADQFGYMAVPAAVATDAGGTYSTSAFPASATVAGVGSQSAAASSLEGVSPTFTYYVGTGTSGADLGSAAPIDAGTYTVLASFAGSADYTSAASIPVTFTISPATPAVAGVSPMSGLTSGGTAVTITGANLAGATAVNFGTALATIVSDTANQIVATSPAESAGTVYVTVVTAGGTSATSSSNQFSYVAGTPTFMLSGPASGSFVAGQTISIQWTDANVGVGSTISLAYDTTTSWGNPKWIEIGGVGAANGSASYSWNTTAVAAGTYYLAGYLYDAGHAYFFHLGTAITIAAGAAPSFTLNGPTSGTFTAGQTVTIQWTDANVGAGSTISLAYDTTTSWGNPKWIEIGGVGAANGSGSYSWNTTGLVAGTYYIAGYLYTPSGIQVLSHLTTSFTIAASSSIATVTSPVAAVLGSSPMIQDLALLEYLA